MGCKKKVLIWNSVLKEKLLAAFIAGMLVASYAGVIPHISFVDTAKAESPPVTSCIKGFVTDPQGLSLHGVNITFLNESESWMNSTFTDEYGYYEIGVFGGYFNFSAEKQGYNPNYTNVKINDSEIIWGNLTLTHAGPPGPGNGTVCGYVRSNITGEGIVNATVCVNRTEGDVFSSCVTTNEAGFYIFDGNISSGNYSVSVFKENIFCIEGNYTFYPETNWLHILPDIDISSGDENCSVYGFVNYTNGSMAVGAIVWLNQTNGPFNGSDITNSSGGYCFNDIPPGNYTLQAFLDNFHSEFRNISIYPGDYRIENLTLFEGSGPPGPGNESGNGTVCGYVRVNGTDEPIPGATVCVNRTDGEPFFACVLTNDSGFYVFDGNVSAGIYDVFVYKEGEGGFPPWTVGDVEVVANETSWVNFLIDMGGSPEPPSPPGGNASNVTVRGVVKNHVTRNPLPNVVILLTQGGGPFGGNMGGPDSYSVENTTNSAGEYILNLTDAPYGSYTIQASLDGYVTYMNWSLTIDNPGVYWVNITLTPFFTQPTYIVGVVTDNETGETISDAEIVLLDANLTHMVEMGEEDMFSNDTGYFSVPVNYSSTFNLIVFKDGYYAKMDEILVITEGTNITHNITLTPAEPDVLSIHVTFTDLDDASITVNRTIIAEAPTLRFLLDFMPDIGGNSNRQVDQNEVEGYLEQLNIFGPTVNVTLDDSETEEGPPDFLKLPLNLILDGSNLDVYEPGTLHASLENLVNTSIDSTASVYFNATFNLTLDGSVLNSLTHNFTVSCEHVVLINSTINIDFTHFYNINQTHHSTNVTVTNNGNTVQIQPGYGDVDELAYTWIDINLNATTVSLPIVDTPTWHVTDTWVFNRTSTGGVQQVTYYVQSKPLRRWDRETYLIPRGFTPVRYLCYEIRKMVYNPSNGYNDEQMVYASINNIDWVVLTNDSMSIDYIVNDLDFPLYAGKQWQTISWWGENVTATVIDMDATKTTGEGTFNHLVLINMTNSTDNVVAQEWYSPDVKFFVNRTRYQDGMIRKTFDLVSHSLGIYIESFDGPYAFDTDSDGLYDGLYVNINLNTSGIRGSEDIRLEGSLYKESFGWGPPTEITWVTYEERDISNSSSPHVINITYSGSLISSSETNGPYTGWLELRELDEWGPAWDYVEFETDYYNYTDFELPVVVIINTSDYGNDTNNNTLYDALTLNVTVNVTQPGLYEICGSIHKVVRYAFWEDWFWVTGGGTGLMYLPDGTSTISLNFDGQEIYESGQSGVFTCHLEIVDQNWTTIYETEKELSRSYSYDSFERPSVSFNRTYMDQRGSHDFINGTSFTVNVSVVVNQGAFNGEARVYEIHGGIHNNSNNDDEWFWGEFITGTCKQVTLHEGENIVPIDFDITELYNYVNTHHYNGSFKVGIGLSDVSNPWFEVDNYRYITRNYTIDDFPEPPILMEVYDDSITDNGSYLTIYVRVNISDPSYANKSYDLHSGVHWVDNSSGYDEWYFITGWGEPKYLTNGVNNIMVNFSGMEIAASAHDGPYVVWVGLDDWETHEPVVNTEYRTHAYTVDQFAAPKVVFNQSYMNQDGQHDFINGTEYLTINVSIDVNTPGTYRLHSGLHIVDTSQGWENWIFIEGTGTPEISLTPGNHIVSLNYDQGSIKNALEEYGYSGVLKAHIGIEDVEAENWMPIANTEYTTQYYTADDFTGSGVQIIEGQCSITNGDLVVTLTINASRNNTYRVHGGVHWIESMNGWDQWNYITGMCVEDQEIINGTHQYNFTFNGWDIYNSMQDGPYKIWIGVENTTTSHLLDEIEITTDPWSYNDFAEAAPDVQINRENMSAGSVDYMNGSYLTVNVSIYKSTNGSETFWIDGGLEYVDENQGIWEFITGVGCPVTLTSGTNIVVLNFNAGEIYDSGYTGPYHVWINLKNQSTWMDIDRFEYITRSYSTDDVPAPPVSFMMENGNPSYCYLNGSYLTINVTINVTDPNYAGPYDLHGGVHYRTDEGWWQHITGTGHPVSLVNGTNNLTLNFNAGEIHQQLPDGYYDNLSVFMGLNPMGDWNEIARCDFETQKFNKNDFPGPSLTMDWTGYYINGSYFTVNLTINVNNVSSNGYDLHGGLNWVDRSSGWDEWRFITGTGHPVDLTEGENQVQLNFNTGDIHTALKENNYNGPIQVWIGINEMGNWNEITHTEFETTPYSYTDFPPLGLMINCTSDYISNNGETLTVNITITASNEYQNRSLDIHSGLHARQGWMWEFITGTGKPINLTQETTTVQLNFSGSSIKASERDGPYDLWVGISEQGNWEDITHTEYQTQPHNYTDFASPKVQIIEDNLTDYLNNSQITVNVTINAKEPGNYILEGDLHWKQNGFMWQWITWSSIDINVTTPGNHTFQLNFNGQEILKAADETGWNGEPLYCWLTVRNSTTWIDISTVEDHRLQGSYTPDDFGEIPISFNGNISERTTGTPYEFLLITIPVNITAPGNYTVHAGLFDSANDTLIATSTQYIDTNSTGSQNITLNFTGTTIYKKHYNGSFEFRAKLLNSTTHDIYDFITDETTVYHYTDFQEAVPEAAINMSAPITDANVNGNLAITLNVTVNTPGGFQLYGELYNADVTAFVAYAMNTTNLTQGEHTITLVFNGSTINDSAIDGPYKLDYLRLSFNDNGTWVELQVEKNAHTTSNYSHSDFGGGA